MEEGPCVAGHVLVKEEMEGARTKLGWGSKTRYRGGVKLVQEASPECASAKETIDRCTNI